MDLEDYHVDVTKEKRFVGIPHKYVISFAAMMPIGGVLLSLYYALVYHHANTTSTHCNVYNWLPSFSATIGNNYPEVRTPIHRNLLEYANCLLSLLHISPPRLSDIYVENCHRFDDHTTYLGCCSLLLLPPTNGPHRTLS